MLCLNQSDFEHQQWSKMSSMPHEIQEATVQAISTLVQILVIKEINLKNLFITQLTMFL